MIGVRLGLIGLLFGFVRLDRSGIRRKKLSGVGKDKVTRKHAKLFRCLHCWCLIKFIFNLIVFHVCVCFRFKVTFHNIFLFLISILI